MIKEMREKQQNGPIMLNEEGKPPRQLNNNEIVQIIQNHQANAKKFNEKLTEMNNTLSSIQSQLIEISMKADILENEKKDLTMENEKLKEEIALLKKQIPEKDANTV